MIDEKSMVMAGCIERCSFQLEAVETSALGVLEDRLSADAHVAGSRLELEIAAP
jgi:hypothetical protein